MMEEKEMNILGILGFVLSVFSLFIAVKTTLGYPVWIIGMVFSVVGLSKERKGFAVAGVIISFISLIAFFVLVTFLLVNLPKI